jgi:hypothetical protein
MSATPLCRCQDARRQLDTRGYPISLPEAGTNFAVNVHCALGGSRATLVTGGPGVSHPAQAESHKGTSLQLAAGPAEYIA